MKRNIFHEWDIRQVNAEGDLVLSLRSKFTTILSFARARSQSEGRNGFRVGKFATSCHSS
ncbi:MAG: hypothetical protein ACEY26_00805 [Candidatus Hodgkinia cicadicola]